LADVAINSIPFVEWKMTGKEPLPLACVIFLSKSTLHSLCSWLFTQLAIVACHFGSRRSVPLVAVFPDAPRVCDFRFVGRFADNCRKSCVYNTLQNGSRRPLTHPPKGGTGAHRMRIACQTVLCQHPYTPASNNRAIRTNSIKGNHVTLWFANAQLGSRPVRGGDGPSQHKTFP
jgi:hypothetical protein